MPRFSSSHDRAGLTPPGESAPPVAATSFPPALPFPGASYAGGGQRLSRRTRALILVGHGSHLNADSSAPVYAHAAAIRASGAFDEVHEAFWKEEPPLTTVLDLAEADDVLIVPLFLSEGYFTREVLPREIGLTGPLTRRGDRSFRYLPPVGTHPAMTGMILRRTRAVLGSDPARRKDATLVVIGHGTERSATSADTVYSLVERLRESSEFSAVTCGFLDEAPRIGEVIATIRTPEVVLVPFFIAEGWHTRETIPAELALEGDVTRVGDQTIWYTPPVGTLPEMADVILEMAAEHEPGAPDDSSAVERGARSGDTVFPVAGGVASARDAFFAHLRAAPEPVRVMDVVIEKLPPGAFRLRHRDDLANPVDSLASSDDPESALAIGRFRADGSYRAMRSSDDLKPGWVFPALDEDGLWRALGRLYPAALQSWYRGTIQPLPVVGYRSWSSRQTAMYADVRKLGSDGVQQVVTSLCASCQRVRCWVDDADGVQAAEAPLPPSRLVRLTREPPRDEEGLSSLPVPCLEPCTLFATRARELAVR